MTTGIAGDESHLFILDALLAGGSGCGRSIGASSLERSGDSGCAARVLALQLLLCGDVWSVRVEWAGVYDGRIVVRAEGCLLMTMVNLDGVDVVQLLFEAAIVSVARGRLNGIGGEQTLGASVVSWDLQVESLAAKEKVVCSRPPVVFRKLRREVR